MLGGFFLVIVYPSIRTKGTRQELLSSRLPERIRKEQLGTLGRQRFFFGLLLAWAPLLSFVWIAFRSISSQKTSGLGAVAGGVSEALITFGLIAGVAFQIAAIFLLVRSCREDRRPLRIVVVTISVCWAALILVAYGLLFWKSLGFGRF